MNSKSKDILMKKKKIKNNFKNQNGLIFINKLLRMMIANKNVWTGVILKIRSQGLVIIKVARKSYLNRVWRLLVLF